MADTPPEPRHPSPPESGSQPESPPESQPVSGSRPKFRPVSGSRPEPRPESESGFDTELGELNLSDWHAHVGKMTGIGFLTIARRLPALVSQAVRLA